MTRVRMARYGVATLVILLTAAAGLYVKKTSSWYESRVTIAFVTTTTFFHGQLYDHFTDNQVFAAITSKRLFANPGTLREIRRRGGTARLDYNVAHWGNEEVPVYDQPYATIRAISKDPAESRRTLDVALSLLTERLDAWQRDNGAGDRLMINWQPIDSIRGPEKQGLQVNRALAVLLLTGMVVTVWAAILAGRIARRRTALAA
jgi:hypothetical protein